MIIAITGGKGGTGKSTISVALASKLAERGSILLVDADVDCPNDHLILGIELSGLHAVEQRIPVFDMGLCSMCGRCGEACRSNAIVSVKGKQPVFAQSQCNGCGACRIVCPSGAIGFGIKQVGDIYFGKKDGIALLSGELKANEPVSELVVSALNNEIEPLKQDYEHIVIDTAAGTHCPVVTALAKADMVLCVTEPTPLGSHDLGLILELLKRLKKKARIIINKSDIGNMGDIDRLSEKYGFPKIAEIAYSEKIVDGYANSRPINISQTEDIVEALGL